MKILQADIWQSQQDIIAVTTNSVLDRKGHLVMGAGLAKQAKKKHPQLPRLAGHWIKFSQLQMDQYGWHVVDLEGTRIGLFQTKINWRDPSTLGILNSSIFKLIYWMKFIEPEATVAMPIPGVGLGGLPKKEVMECLEGIAEEVGDRVVFYEWIPF